MRSGQRSEEAQSLVGMAVSGGLCVPVRGVMDSREVVVVVVVVEQ